MKVVSLAPMNATHVCVCVPAFDVYFIEMIVFIGFNRTPTEDLCGEVFEKLCVLFSSFVHLGQTGTHVRAGNTHIHTV